MPPFGTPVKVDLRNQSQLSEALRGIRPEAVVHTAALTDVDLCEKEKALATAINSNATRTIGRLATEVKASLLYVSTDYVFDGEKGSYGEVEEPNPVNFYGVTKLGGERAIREEATDYLIVRPSVIYGPPPPSGKVNFAMWLMDHLRMGEHVEVLKDQYVSPTSSTSLAEMILESVERNLTGTFHLAGASRVSRYDFARGLAEVFGFDVSLIEPVSMDEMHWLAKRPRDSSLDVSKANSTLRTKPLDLSSSLITLKQIIALGGKA